MTLRINADEGRILLSCPADGGPNSDILFWTATIEDQFGRWHNWIDVTMERPLKYCK